MPASHNFTRRYNPFDHYLAFSIVVIAFAFKLEYQLPILMGLITLTMLSHQRRRIYRGFLRFVMPLIVIGVVVNGIFSAGNVVLSIGAISFKDQGLLFATKVAVRLALIVLAMGYYFSRVDTDVLSEYLISRGVDRRFVYIYSLSVAMVSLMKDKLQKIYTAQSARGFDASGSLAVRVRSILPLLIPLTYSYLAESIDRGMALRAAHLDPHDRTTDRGRSTLLKIESSKTGLIAGRAALALSVALGIFQLAS